MLEVLLLVGWSWLTYLWLQLQVAGQMLHFTVCALEHCTLGCCFEIPNSQGLYFRRRNKTFYCKWISWSGCTVDLLYHMANRNFDSSETRFYYFLKLELCMNKSCWSYSVACQFLSHSDFCICSRQWSVLLILCSDFCSSHPMCHSLYSWWLGFKWDGDSQQSLFTYFIES